MKLKKILNTLIINLFLLNTLQAEEIYPDQNLEPLDVISIQLKALQKNDQPKIDSGIEQTWLFAHPKNKLVTGPYSRFRIMLYDPHYQILLNHKSHSINLIQSDDKKFVYGVNVVSKDNQNFFYEWHIEKGTEENCNNCWFTSAVSYPQVKGQNI